MKLDKRISISEPTPEDMIYMAHHMREIDRLEFMVMSGQEPYQALLTSQQHSRKMLCGRWKGTPVVMFGITANDLLSGRATPWMCATDDLYRKDVKPQFLRASRKALGDLSEGYSYLWNYVHSSNDKAIRWLKWLGFVFPGSKITFKGHPFEFFKLEAEDVLSGSHSGHH